MTLLEKAASATETEGVRLTEAAAGKVREIAAQQGFKDNYYLFVGVKGGGCSGLQFVLDLRDAEQAPPAETDELFHSQGVVVSCDLKSYIVGNLAGTLLDYKSDLMQSGFKFENPNFQRKCGCGKSYSP